MCRGASGPCFLGVCAASGSVCLGFVRGGCRGGARRLCLCAAACPGVLAALGAAGLWMLRVASREGFFGFFLAFSVFVCLCLSLFVFVLSLFVFVLSLFLSFFVFCLCFCLVLYFCLLCCWFFFAYFCLGGATLCGGVSSVRRQLGTSAA